MLSYHWVYFYLANRLTSVLYFCGDVLVSCSFHDYFFAR